MHRISHLFPKSIPSQITACILVIFTFFTVVSFYSIYQFKSLHQNLEVFNSQFQPLLQSINSLKTEILHNMENVEKMDEEFRTKAHENIQLLETSLKHATSDTQTLELFQTIELSLKKYFDLQDQIINHLSHSQFKKLKEDKDQLFVEKFKWKQNTTTLYELIDLEAQKKIVSIQQKTQSTASLHYYGVIFVCLFSLIPIFFSYKALKPIEQLIQRVRNISKGGDPSPWAQDDKNKMRGELAELAREINKMSFSLKQRDQALLIQKQKLKEAYHDIQQQNIHLQFLSRSERLATIGRMSAQIAHEIRNPLNSLLLNIEYLQEQSRKKGFQDEKVFDSLISQIHRLKEMTNSYLQFTKMPASQKTKIEINNLLKELCSFYKDEKVTILKEFDTSLPSLTCDPLQLKEAFLNILKNAGESMAEGGCVTIKTHYNSANKMIEISFQDEGEGIPEDKRKNVFLPFYSTKAQGVGLGLTLTQQIIEEHGGKIECQNNTPRGTIFRVGLPMTL